MLSWQLTAIIITLIVCFTVLILASMSVTISEKRSVEHTMVRDFLRAREQEDSKRRPVDPGQN